MARERKFKEKKDYIRTCSVTKNSNSKFDGQNRVTAAGMCDRCVAYLYDTQVLCGANVILRIALKSTLGAFELIPLHLHSHHLQQ